jgi:hypothetical protein
VAGAVFFMQELLTEIGSGVNRNVSRGGAIHESSRGGKRRGNSATRHCEERSDAAIPRPDLKPAGCQRLTIVSFRAGRDSVPAVRVGAHWCMGSCCQISARLWCMGFWSSSSQPGTDAAACGARRSKQGSTQMQADARKTRG